MSELAGALIGTLFAALGVAAMLVAGLRFHSRDRSLLYFGLFTLLYGVRLAARSGTVHEAFAVSVAVWLQIDAALTYVMVVPVALFAAAFFGPGWKSSLRRLWQANIVYAGAAIAWELATGRPGSLIVLNPAAVYVNFAVLIPHGVAGLRDLTWTRETVGVVAGAAVFIVVVAYETVAGRGLIAPGVHAEPAALLGFVAALGYAVAQRTFRDERRLEAVARELQMARRIQQSILPRELPVFRGARVAARCLPATEVAGDFYDVVPMGPDRFAVLVADVSGHGVPAALIASMVKVVLAAEMERADDPAVVLSRMNRTLFGKFELAYVTAVLAFVDVGARRVVYANAGHPSVLVRRADMTLHRLEERNLLLGFSPDVAYASGEWILEDGDRLLFCTDGLLEASDPKGEQFGDRRLDEWVGTAREADTERWSEALVREAKAWTCAPADPLPDDLTLVVVDVP